MHDIRHRIGTAAAPGDVFAAIATREGLRGWWTTDVRGDESPGGSLEFYFGGPEPAAVMEVVDHLTGERVVWRCTAGPDEWVDTTFTFEVRADEAETALMFTNAGWREPVPFLHHCSTKWAFFLLGLKASLEGAPGVAFPDDTPISAWG